MRLRSATVQVPVDAPVDLETLFDGEFSYVWNSLRRLGIHERDLEDMTHEIFLQVHRHWAAYDTSRPARPWLFGFCYRIAADYRRLARHRGTLVGDPPSSTRCSAPRDRRRTNSSSSARRWSSCTSRSTGSISISAPSSFCTISTDVR